MPVTAAKSIEQFEQVGWETGLQDSGDLEAATSTISATSEPGAANYSSALTVAAPTDSRIVVRRLGVRLQVTVDSWAGGGTTLNYRIKRGGVSIGTGTLTAAAGTGALLVAHDVSSGTLTGAGTYEVFLWVNAGSCVVSVCQVWVGVGGTGLGYWGAPIVEFQQVGMIQAEAETTCQGTGTYLLHVHLLATGVASLSAQANVYTSSVAPSIALRTSYGGVMLSHGAVYVSLGSPTVATDLVYFSNVWFQVRRLV